MTMQETNDMTHDLRLILTAIELQGEEVAASCSTAHVAHQIAKRLHERFAALKIKATIQRERHIVGIRVW
jgi:hypothetical protein